MIDAAAAVEALGPGQKALVVAQLALAAVVVGHAVAHRLAALHPADALVVAQRIIAPFQGRFAISSSESFITAFYSFTISVSMCVQRNNGNNNQIGLD